MKKTLMLLALTALCAGSVACSSLPEKAEESEAPLVEAQAEPEMEEVAPPVVSEPVMNESTQSGSSSSLGASSSGRGH